MWMFEQVMHAPYVVTGGANAVHVDVSFMISFSNGGISGQVFSLCVLSIAKVIRLSAF